MRNELNLSSVSRLTLLVRTIMVMMKMIFRTSSNSRIIKRSCLSRPFLLALNLVIMSLTIVLLVDFKCCLAAVVGCVLNVTVNVKVVFGVIVAARSKEFEI